MQYIKFGFGRCTSEASTDIRDNYISREEGVALVKKYDGEFPSQDIDEFLSYMNISKDKFFNIVNKFRPKELWVKQNDKWHLNHKIY